MVTKGVEILTNDPKTPKQLVDVDLDIRPGIAVVPPELDFGNVPAAGSKRFQVDLKAARTRPFKVRAAAAAAPYVSVESEPLELEERAGTRLVVKVLPGAPPGPFSTKITVETDDASRPRIEIPLRGVGAGGVAVDPSRIVFESASAGADIGTVAVSGKALKVTGVSTSTPQIEAALQPRPDGTYSVKVKVAASAKPGRIMAKVFARHHGCHTTRDRDSGHGPGSLADAARRAASVGDARHRARGGGDLQCGSAVAALARR